MNHYFKCIDIWYGASLVPGDSTLWGHKCPGLKEKWFHILYCKNLEGENRWVLQAHWASCLYWFAYSNLIFSLLCI